jgi:hypothetical protein
MSNVPSQINPPQLLLAGCTVLFSGIMVLCAITGNLTSQSHPTVSKVTSTSHTPTVVSTKTSTKTVPATATITPSPLDTMGMVLGGTFGSFKSVWGQPDPQSANTPVPEFQRDCGSDGKAWCLMLGTYPPYNDQARVGTITLQGAHMGDTPWDLETAQRICRAYLPPDAQYVRQTTNADGDIIDVYMSSDLKSIFPSDTFVDKNDNLVAPGTFVVAYLFSFVILNSVEVCDLATGIPY